MFPFSFLILIEYFMINLQLCLKVDRKPVRKCFQFERRKFSCFMGKKALTRNTPD